MTHKQKTAIGILTPPIGSHSLIPLSNLLNILMPQTQSIYLITGNEGYTLFKKDTRLHVLGVDHISKGNFITRILTFIFMQIRISIALVNVVKKCDVWIFFLGGENLILPMCVAKLFRKPVYLMLAGSSTNTSVYKSLIFCLNILRKINYILSDRIIVYSKKIIVEWNLYAWTNKIIIAHEHVIDCKKFADATPYYNRDAIIGYIGRLSEEKGIWNFILAIDLILKERQDVKFLIIGEGLLQEKIEHYVTQNGLQAYVNIEGWISHDAIPKYLNQLSFLILPSFTEGLPNIILEAMACGTPVLATPVGTIPEIIKDGETGFIIENNSPECIRWNVIRVLNFPNVERIANNGRQFIEENYSFKKTSSLWKTLIGNPL